MNEKYAVLRRLREAEAGLAFSLDVFGDFLAKREGYESINGLEAVNLYLVLKFHWLPGVVRSMSVEDKRFALHSEMQGWTLPKEAL